VPLRAGWLQRGILTTNINLDEGTCSLDLLEEAAEYFGLGLPQARAIIKEVATATARWRQVLVNDLPPMLDALQR
jgi:serine/threonine-protein kinase HipA